MSFPAPMHPKPVIGIKPGIVFQAGSNALGDITNIGIGWTRLVVNLNGFVNHLDDYLCTLLPNENLQCLQEIQEPVLEVQTKYDENNLKPSKLFR